MDHILIIDASNRLVVSSLDPGCREACYDLTNTECEKKCLGNKGEARRRGKIFVPSGTVFLCSDDKDLLNSKKVFLKQLKFYAEMIDAFVEIQKLTIEQVKRENGRLVHNLTTLNSHIIQEIYNIVPQDDLSGRPADQIRTIAAAISVDTNIAAQAALRILKNAVAARTEMQIVRRLRTAGQLPTPMKAHFIHKVIKNVLITFFQDSLGCQINWNLRASKAKIFVDYESISAALYRLFENFIKYCAPNSTIDIGFDSDGSRLKIIFEMKSLIIHQDEQEKIFEEGYSGESARHCRLNGDGLGLHFVTEMLGLNNAKIHVVAGTKIEFIGGREYAPNRFTIDFSPGSIVD